MRELDTDGSIVSWARQQQADKLATSLKQEMQMNSKQTKANRGNALSWAVERALTKLV